MRKASKFIYIRSDGKPFDLLPPTTTTMYSTKLTINYSKIERHSSFAFNRSNLPFCLTILRCKLGERTTICTKKQRKSNQNALHTMLNLFECRCVCFHHDYLICVWRFLWQKLNGGKKLSLQF